NSSPPIIPTTSATTSGWSLPRPPASERESAMRTDRIDPGWAWAKYQPSDDSPWDLKKVGHLYRRAAFGGNWPELQTALKVGPDKTIDSLLEGGKETAEFIALCDQMAASIVRSNNGRQASAWWLYRMLYTAHPLREKLTLFWHNHFATSNKKVNNAGY